MLESPLPEYHPPIDKCAGGDPQQLELGIIDPNPEFARFGIRTPEGWVSVALTPIGPVWTGRTIGGQRIGRFSSCADALRALRARLR